MSTVDFSGNGHVIPVDVSSCDVRFDLSFSESSWSDYNKVYIHYSNHTYDSSVSTTHVQEVEVTESNFNRKSVTISNIQVFHSDTDLVVDDISKNQYEFQIYHLDTNFNLKGGNDNSVQLEVYGHMNAPSISVKDSGNFSYTLTVTVPNYADISNDISGFLVTTGGPTWNTNISALDAQAYDYNAYAGVSDASLNNYVLNTTFIEKSEFTYTLNVNDATFDLRVCDPSFAWGEDIPSGHLKREVINAKDITNFTKFRIENSIRILDVNNVLGLISNTVYAAGDSLPSPMASITLHTNDDNLDDISYTSSGKGINQKVKITGTPPSNMPTTNEYKTRIFHTQQDISSEYLNDNEKFVNYLTNIYGDVSSKSGADLNSILEDNSWNMVDNVSLHQEVGSSAWHLETVLDGLQDSSAVYIIVQMKDSYGSSYVEYTQMSKLKIITATPYAPPPKIMNISVSPHGTQHDATTNYVYQDSTDIHVDFSLNQYVPSEVGDINKIIMYKETVQLGQDLYGESGDMAGISVSLSSDDGSIVAIGAHYNDGNGFAAGHVRVFQWDGTTWAQIGGDIDGEDEWDNYGLSVSLSSDGSIVAIGATGNDGNGSNAGHVRVFQWNGATSTWAQIGSDIDGEAKSDSSGYSVSLSSDGSIVAIGATGNDGNAPSSGHVRVFQWNGTTWAPMGGDIDGEAAWDKSGYSVSLSSDGSTVAIGACGWSTYGYIGNVRVFQWNGTTWAPMGGNIDGEAVADWGGVSVSLSSDGSIVAIGVPFNAPSMSGHVRVFQWNGATSTWAQIGSDIDGEASNDYSGRSVSLSSDGYIVAIGSNGNDGNGSNAGHVRVFQWNGATWQKIGVDIHGEAAGDQSGKSVSLSSDGSRIAIGAPFNDENGSYSGHAHVYEIGIGPIEIDVSGNVEDLSTETMLTGPFNNASQSEKSYRLNISNNDHLPLTEGTDLEFSLLFANDYYDNTEYTTTNDYNSPYVDISVVDKPDLLSGVTFTPMDGTSNNEKGYVKIEMPATPLSGTDGMGNNYSDLFSIPVTLFIEPVGDVSNVFINAYSDIDKVNNTIEHPMTGSSQHIYNQENIVYHTSLTRPDTDSSFVLDVYSPLDVKPFKYSIAAYNDKYKLSYKTTYKAHLHSSDGPDIADLSGDLNWIHSGSLVTKHGFTNTLTVIDGPFDGHPNNNDGTITLRFQETEDGFYGRGDFSNNCVVVLENSDGIYIPDTSGNNERVKPTQDGDLTVTYDISGIDGGDISNGHTFTYYLKNTVVGITGPAASETFYTRKHTDAPDISLQSASSSDSSNYATPNITPSVIDYIVVKMPDQDSSGANYGGDVDYSNNKTDYTLIIEIFENSLKKTEFEVKEDTSVPYFQDFTLIDISSVGQLYSYQPSSTTTIQATSKLPNAGGEFRFRLTNLQENTAYEVKAKIKNTINTVNSTVAFSGYDTLSLGSTDKDISANPSSFTNVKPNLTATVVNDTSLQPPLDLERVHLSWDAVSDQHDSRVYGYVVIATIRDEDYAIWSGDETTTDVSFHSGHEFFANYHNPNNSSLVSSDISSNHDGFLQNIANTFYLPDIKTPIYGLPITYKVRTILIDQDDIIYKGDSSYNLQIDSNTITLTPKTRPTIHSVTVNYDASEDNIESFDISLSTGGDDLDKVLVIVTGKDMNPIQHETNDLSSIPLSGIHNHQLTPLDSISLSSNNDDNDSIIVINSPQGGNLYHLNDLKNGITTTTTTTTTTITTTTDTLEGFEQMGGDIDGEGEGDNFGSTVSLSSNGSIVAIGAYRNDETGSNAGHVRVFQLIGTTWTQIGVDIDGEEEGDYFGHSVSLSSNGSILAVGARFNDGVNGSRSGHARVFQWNGTTWAPMGGDIDGEAGDDWYGHSVSLSSDGSILAVGGYRNDGNGNNSGHVRVFQWDGTTSTWEQISGDIDGKASDNYSGYSVTLSRDGSTVAIGAIYGGVGDPYYVRPGHVRVWAISTGGTQEITNTIPITNNINIKQYALPDPSYNMIHLNAP